MTEDIFLPSFMSEMKKISSLSLKIDPQEKFRKIYEELWIEHNFVAPLNFNFMVCDGSRGLTEFQGGIKALYARALVHSFKGKEFIDRIAETKVFVDYLLQKEDSYMKAVELNALKKALEKVDEALAIYDGSLYPTFPLSALNNEKIAKAKTEEFKALAAVYKQAYDENQVLIGFCKDSNVSYIRAKVLIDCLKIEAPRIGEEVSRQMYPSRIAKKLKKLKEEASEREKKLLESYCYEFELKTSDEEVFSNLSLNPGFTTPLILAPQPLYLEAAYEKKRDWWNSIFREKTSKLKPELYEIVKLLDEVYSLPPLATICWKPHHGLEVHRVDLSGWSLGVKMKWGDLKENIFIKEKAFINCCKEIVEKLNALSLTPTIIGPLTDVDTLVRIDNSVYRDVYEPILINTLKKTGLKAKLRRRRLREILLRRMR
ncbi:DNA double-strand break repair nuclease NurA [Candidatus Bathyarchaeota archaeon]|nr:DNA double-strand break repair nuclease NurA [Candidatus Bathyarchaeota archaeon]